MGKEAEEDPADIFDTSLSTLFDIPPIAFSTLSPETFYTYIPPAGSPSPVPIQLRIPQPPPKLHTTLQANYVWLAGIYLSDLICSHHIDVRGTMVAELGAGAGLPGIAACREGAVVVSSDWEAPQILDVLRGNFERACMCSKWSVLGYQWGKDVSPLLDTLESGKRFDILLLADTLWVTEAHAELLDSVFELLEVGGTAHIAAGLHTGRGPLERFISSARSRGAVITIIRQVLWQSNKRDERWDEYVSPTVTLEEERGVVVYFTLQLHTRLLD
ncbi:MAG: hypothetical protein TREMPRED_002937 [Tremellales sp. Tagirdzhanova-0007]|nr:MAG: hypothetical protein TREMPRED_002937 [Tremellales sp. Tagirdzhanova-0007]